jgi:hypothetical protein
MSVQIKIEISVLSDKGVSIVGNAPMNLPRVSERFDALLDGKINGDLLLSDTVSGAITEIDMALREPLGQCLGQLAQNTVDVMKLRSETKAVVEPEKAAVDGN